jgi:phage gpG-like protein
MNPNDFIKNILSDVRVDLTDEFDRNFARKGFFDKKWRGTNLPNQRGSLLSRSGKLRRSIMSKQTGTSVTWSSSLPYASINNNGGEIEVTAKMKSFFWAMFYKADGAITMKRKADKDVVMRETDRNKKLSAEAQQWKNLALQKVGSKMKIEQRQFIGDHPIVRQRIEDVVGINMKELETYYFNQLKQK